MVKNGTPSAIQRLFFDIDDTLYSTSDFARTARKNSVRALVDVGIRAEPDALFEELQEVIREFSSNYQYHYDKLLLRIPDDALTEVDRNVAIAAAVIAYHRTKHEQLEPFPDVRRFLDCLEASSIPEKPGIISEGLSVKQAEKILRLDLYPYFDPHAIFISEKVGISKPNPKLFRTALRESNTDPSKAMFVGDRPEKDIAPANRVGMITVLVKRGTKYSDKEITSEPDYTIESFRELVPVLSDDFNVEIPAF